MNNKKYDGKMHQTAYVETLREIVERSTSLYSDRPAYMYKEAHGEPFKTVTYGEHREMLDALGTALIDMRLKGKKIAVVGENSYRWILSYFTTACGVGVIVPIDKNLPYDEMVNLLKRADVALLFASGAMMKSVQGLLKDVRTLKTIAVTDHPELAEEAIEKNKNIITQDELIARGRELIAEGNREYLDAAVDKEDLSTILFTSGTTGLAKGVMLCHRNFAANIMGMSKYYHAPDNHRMLSILPLHHAYEMTATCMTTFYQGQTVVICEGLKHIQPNFVEAECGTMLGVPLIFEMIYKKIWVKAEKTGRDKKLRRGISISKRLDLRNNPRATSRMFKAVKEQFGGDIHTFIVGGAAVEPRVIIELEAMGLPIFQGYGMTECAPVIAMNSDMYSKAASVGRPLPGIEVRIVDKDETGMGEIICKGASVMMGYYKDPENTAKTIKDGWLYTGDYGYMDEDGFLYVTGRKKNVIVTKGGKNIFPEEVEYYLMLNEFVNEVIVYGQVGEDKNDPVCTAIIYPDFEALADAGYRNMADVYKKLKQVADEANEQMPAYKRVKRIEVRDREFVKTTTLKIKRFEKENYEHCYDGN